MHASIHSKLSEEKTTIFYYIPWHILCIKKNYLFCLTIKKAVVKVIIQKHVSIFNMFIGKSKVVIIWHCILTIVFGFIYSLDTLGSCTLLSFNISSWNWKIVPMVLVQRKYVTWVKYFTKIFYLWISIGFFVGCIISGWFFFNETRLSFFR